MATDWIRQEVKNPVGVNKSLDTTDIPLEVWSDVLNVSFKGGRCRKTQGHEETFGTPTVAPYGLLSVVRDGTLYWIYPGLDLIYRTQGVTHTNISRTTGGVYTGAESDFWNGGVLNSVPVLNNGVDVPQAWAYSTSNFENLPNWPATLRAKVIRPYKNYLVALNLEDNSVLEPHSVAWSTAADPGAVPDSWADNDPTKESGRAFLADTSGKIVDGKPMRDMFIIYKEDAVYSMRYVGGVFVWQFRQLFNDVGCMSQDCAAEFEGQHFVVTQGDVYVHNGVQKRSIIDNKMREYLFSAIDPNFNERTRVIANHSRTEMWICFVSVDSTTGWSDTALIWNWIEDTWTIRELPNIITGAYGVVDPQTSDEWNADSQGWDVDSTVWNDQNYNPSKLKILLASPTDSRIYLVGNTSLFIDTTFQSTLEKVNMSFGDDHSIKSIHSITPHVVGSGTIVAHVGFQMLQTDPINWKGPYTFTIGSDYKIDCRAAGRYLSVRFDIDSSGDWAFNGYTMEGNAVIGTR